MSELARGWRRLGLALVLAAAVLCPLPGRAEEAPLTSADVTELADMLDAALTGAASYAQAEAQARHLEAAVLERFGAESREAVEIGRILTMAATLQGRVDEGTARGRAMVETGLRVIEGDDPLIYRAVAAYAVALRASGQGREALALVSEALTEADARLPPDALAGDELRLVQAGLAVEAGDSATALDAFARLDERLGTRSDAEALALQAMARIGWGELQVQLGAPEAAIDSFGTAITALDRQFAAVRHPRMVPVRLSAVARKAGLLVQVGRGDEVEPLVRPLMDEVEAVYGPEAPVWADLAFPLAVTLAGTEAGAPRADEALALMRRVVANWGAVYDAETLDLLRARMSLAVLLASRGDLAGAMAEIDAMDGHALPEMQSQLTFVLHEAQLAGRIDAAQAVDGVLRLMQDTQDAGAAAAQRLLADRLAAGTDAGAAALRARSDARGRLRADQAALAAVASQPLEDRDEAVVAALREGVRADRAALEAAEARLARDFPALAQMTGALPLTLAEIRARLAEDEALVVLAPPTGPQDPGLVVAVSRTAVDWHTFQADAPEVEAAVLRLRQGIGLRLGLRGAAALDDGADAPADFDREAAAWLWAQSFGQVEGVIGGKAHLWVEMRGVMGALPPQLLLTAPAGEGSGAVPWAMRRFSFSILPAISGLPQPGGAAALAPGRGFIGFADPDLADLGAGLAPLRETAGELHEVAAALDADPAGLHVGPGASEAAVKAAPLAGAGVIYFATHGLVSGEVAALDEPALALTPGGGEDGFLTASEIAELPLNARFVVLSACNTATGGTPGAEALSGLTQSFLYAGARGLLVSHWPVESRSAAHLMTETFRRLGQDPGLRAAEAERQAMLAMADDPAGRWSHPAHWAPFVLVGAPD